MNCKNCLGKELETFIDLGMQPSGNIYSNEPNQEVKKYPLQMSVCKACWQVQLNTENQPTNEELYNNHPYLSGTSFSVLKYFDEMISQTSDKYPQIKSGTVLDIGSNDGSLLKKYKDKRFITLGIEPCKTIAEIARKQGIETIEAYWDEKTARQFNGKRFDIITATSVIYHMPDLRGFVKAVKQVMSERSLFIVQILDLKAILEKVQFDTMYSEHTFLHSLTCLNRLFNELGLKILDVNKSVTRGDSLTLWASRTDSTYYKIKPIVKQYMDEEANLKDINTYHNFAKNVEENRLNLMDLLNKLKKQKKTVYALGAPLKLSTLVNYYDIDSKLIQKATEVNHLKIGKYVPGTDIPIVDETRILKQPDYYLLASWNFGIDYFKNKYPNQKFINPHQLK